MAETLLGMVEEGQALATILNKSHQTALHYASAQGCFEIVQSLLQLDPSKAEQADKFHKTPADWARQFGYEVFCSLSSSWRTWIAAVATYTHTHKQEHPAHGMYTPHTCSLPMQTCITKLHLYLSLSCRPFALSTSRPAYPLCVSLSSYAVLVCGPF